MGASNAGGVGKNRDSRRICVCRIDDCCSAINNWRWTVQFTTQTVTRQWILFVTAIMDDHDEQENRTEFICTQRSGKSVAIVTNNRRLRSTYCTTCIEANYWQTRSITQPLCDSRATCFKCRNRVEGLFEVTGCHVGSTSVNISETVQGRHKIAIGD